MFPITDTNGEIAGFGGRVFKDQTGKYNKYINTGDTPTYNKSRIIYGLYQAAKSIKECGFALLSEGYTDVISMHCGRNTNTIATCGTALTTEHVKIIGRYTKHVITVRDGDEAGIKATKKDVHQLLQSGFKAEVLPLPEGEDPDSFSNPLRFSSYAGF